MYDELVKALRETDFGDTCVLCEHEDMCKGNDCIIIQAADAIEELQADKAALNGTITNLLEQIKDLGKPRWISVKERLPEENAPCIVYNKDYGPMVGWRVDGERFRIPGSRFPDHPTHWMPLPEPPKEEQA